MTVLRSDIERALDDLKSNEGGMKFQGLGVILAKLRWPEFVACERKNDLGADALIRAHQTSDRIGRALACSITPTLAKISDDATEIRKSYPDVTFLLFVTSQKVGNTTIAEWTLRLKETHGYDLMVIPREEIVISLMMPANAELCRSHLGLHIPLEHSVSELTGLVREAALEELTKWSRRIEGKPLIDLAMQKLDPNGRESEHILRLKDVSELLSTGRRIVLEAPAGRGKTTQLIRLAKAQPISSSISFLIDLPAWARSKTGILNFLAGKLAFQSRSLDISKLARICNAQHCVFLLNGWNEVAESEHSQAADALQVLEREFPAAGIIVATRSHHLTPPLPGALRYRLTSIDRQERRQYLKERLQAGADSLYEKLEADRVLEDLTRTPLILAEVVNIYEAGQEISSTKVGVLNTVIELLEQSEEHRNHLQIPPLSGHSRSYLENLAMGMIAKGEVYIEDHKARLAITDKARELVESGQTGTIAEPVTVLGLLCSHHVLERFDYPSVAYRFEHQQFQEFFAAQELKRQLWTLLSDENDVPKQFEFTKKYLNEPAWEESALMMAENIGSVQSGMEFADHVRAGKLLILMALNVDPIFAANLARLCGKGVRDQVFADVSRRLRSWHESADRHHQTCSLAAMLATGSPVFNDILLPLLSNNDQQVRLSTYRVAQQFYLSTLGVDWQVTIGRWSEEARIDLVSELLHDRNNSEIVSYVLTESNAKVKEAAISALSWIGAQSDASRILATLNGEHWTEAILRLGPQLTPFLDKQRSIDVLRSRASSSANSVEKLHILLHIAELFETDVCEEIKSALTHLPLSGNHQLGHLLRQAVEVVQRSDATWVSNWVGEQIANGGLWYEHCLPFVTKISTELKERLLAEIEGKDLAHLETKIISVLAASADEEIVQQAISKVCALQNKITGTKRDTHVLDRTIIRQLENLLREIPANVLVTALSKQLSSDIDLIFLGTICEIFSSVGRGMRDDRSSLKESLRLLLRKYLKNGLSVLLSSEDFWGQKKADYSTTIAAVGEPEDLELVQKVIYADIERIRTGRVARTKGDRTEVGNGAIMSHSRWHVRVIDQLAQEKGDSLFIELLDAPEFEGDVAEHMASLMNLRKVKERLGGFMDYSQIVEMRLGKIQIALEEGRRKKFVEALTKKIGELLEQRRGSSKPEEFDYRLHKFVAALAVLDGKSSINLVLEVASLLGQRDDWGKVSIIENLFFSGAELSVSQVYGLLCPILDRFKAQGYHDQNTLYSTKRALCLLLFAHPPCEGITQLQQIISELGLAPYELREIVSAVGKSRSSEAVRFLKDLARKEEYVKILHGDIIHSLVAIDSQESRDALLSLVDFEIQDGLPAEIADERDRLLVNRISEIAHEDPQVQMRLSHLCSMDLPSPNRLLLSAIMKQLATPDAAMAALRLINDKGRPPICFDTHQQIEELFVEHRPSAPGSSSYTLTPKQSAALRSKLFEMARTDENRKISAYSLLGQIEEWRLEYGRPTGEPRHPSINSKLPWPSH